MELYNKIVLRHKRPFSKNDCYVPNTPMLEVNSPTPVSNLYETDICYWQQCWDIRHDIIEHLIKTHGYPSDMGLYVLSVEDIVEIIHILNKFLDNNINFNKTKVPLLKKIYNWVYDVTYNIEEDIKSLKWLLKYIDTNEDNVEEIYFRDDC